MKIKKIYFAFVFTTIIFSLGFASAQNNPGHPLSQIDNLIKTCGPGFVQNITSTGPVCATPSGGGGGSGYSRLQNEGTNLTQRSIINFIGSGVNCVDNNAKTECAINSSGGGDNLGNHVATQNIKLNNNLLTNDGGTEGLAIYDDGNLATLNKFAIGLVTPSYPLHVFTSVANGRAIYGHADDSGGIGVYGEYSKANVAGYGVRGLSAPGGVGVHGQISSGSGGMAVVGQNSNTGGWGVYCNAGSTAKCGGTKDWDGSSDSRLKQDIKTIQDPLEKVLKLRGVTYYWKDDEKKENPEMGFVAQEVLPLVPEVVSTDQNGYYTMQKGSITALLVEAIQEQQSQIEQLKKENAELQKSAWGQHNEISELRNAICEINPNNKICSN